MLEISKRDIRKWCRALRSGEYKQTTLTLQDKNGYCCLGVACKVFIPSDRLKFSPHNYISGSMPSFQINAPNWLAKISSDFYKKVNVSLFELNDGTKDDLSENIFSFTFDEIADLLEAVYIHEVLKIESE